MKKFRTIYLATLFTIGLLTITSCDDDNDSTNNVCDNSYVSNQMTAAYSVNNGYDDTVVTMDLETHEYTMIINANGEICSVGYQNPSTWTGSYTIEIINETSGAIYTGSHSFSQTALDYQSITPVVAVSSGDTITVKRTLSNYNSFNDLIGRMFIKSTGGGGDIPYPITAGNIKFLSSNFHGSGSPAPNFGQPYIPLGFKVN